MAFLRNTTVNLLNLHYAIHALAMAGGGAFFIAYLLRTGVPAPVVMCAFALITGARFLIRPFVLAFGKRCGLRPLVCAGTLISALQYPILAYVHGADAALLATCLIAALGDTFYWTSYHAYFAALGDAEHRGHQISAREALSAIVGIAAPLIGGWSLATLGPKATFFTTAAVQCLAALPFLGTPNVAVPGDAPGSFKAAYSGMAMFVADGWTQATCGFTWEIVLFLALSKDYAAYGGAMALAAFVGALGGLLLGRLIDRGHGKRAVWLSAAAMTVLVTLRAVSGGSVALALLANALGALTSRITTTTLMTAVYNEAKRSPCVLRFHIATEGSWDIGCASGALGSAALIAAGAPIGGAILLAFAGVAATFVLLQRYYTAKPHAAPVPI